MQTENTRAIIDKCKQETRIRYESKGNTFFTPRMRGINYLQVGKSKIITSKIVLLAEWGYELVRRLRAWWRRLSEWLFSRHPELPTGHLDSRLVGRFIHEGDRGQGPPIHHLALEFWGRTWWYSWRKISAGRTDADGNFALPFPVRSANRLSIRSLRLEVHKHCRVFFKNEQPDFHDDIFQVFPVVKNDLTGMDYNLRTMPLNYWCYRPDAATPRAVVNNPDNDAPEFYAQGRIDAFMEQVIPIELTKIKHLEQIELAPDTLTIEQIQADYPMNLTVCIEKQLPGYTRGDDWFGERMMNGMNRGCFVPDETRPGHWWMRYFGVCWYERNDIYALPDVAILFTLKEDGLPIPCEIQLTGRLSREDKDPALTRIFTPADGAAWLQAKRVARVGGAFCTEVEEHFAGTHLNAEQYAVAAHRNLRLNPVACLLLPHLKEVSLIDHTADQNLIGGYIPTATALTQDALVQRTRDIMGMQDWCHWKPMQPISYAHTCAKAEHLFWTMLREYVDEFFQENEAAIKEQWLEIYRFADDLTTRSAPVFLTAPKDAPPADPYSQSLAAMRREYYAQQYSFDLNLPRETVSGELKAVSRITAADAWEKAAPEDWQRLKDACCYIIMQATYLHTWINEHQYDDLGEIRYSSGGLRFGEKPSGIMAPESDNDIAPDLTRSTQMLWFTNFLSRTEYGFITRNEEGDVNPRLIRRLEALREEFKALGVDIDAIESRTNI
jgi:Lipoxygenase